MNFGNRVKGLLGSTMFWSLLIFAILVVAISFGISGVSQSVAEQQQELLVSTVRRSAVQCYALEGSYPSDLQYLVENYGLYYDKENYVVHYSFVAGNLLPEIAVFYLGEETPPV